MAAAAATAHQSTPHSASEPQYVPVMIIQEGIGTQTFCRWTDNEEQLLRFFTQVRKLENQNPANNLILEQTGVRIVIPSSIFDDSPKCLIGEEAVMELVDQFELFETLADTTGILRYEMHDGKYQFDEHEFKEFCKFNEEGDDADFESFSDRVNTLCGTWEYQYSDDDDDDNDNDDEDYDHNDD